MHFVVCVDGSEQSDLALDHAVHLADATDGELTVVHAVDPQVYEQRGAGPIRDRPDADQHFVVEAVEDAEARGEEILAEAVASVGDVPAEDVLLYGNPVEAVVDYVAKHVGEVDGVVVGHREVSERLERVLGSVAKGLIERSPVPVTVVGE